MSATKEQPTSTLPMTDDQLEALEAWGNAPVPGGFTKADYVGACEEADGLIREAGAEIRRLRTVNETLLVACELAEGALVSSPDLLRMVRHAIAKAKA